MESVLWFIKTDLVKRPLRSSLIVIMGAIAVLVLAVMLSLSNVGFAILEGYVNVLNPKVIVVMGPALPLSPLEASKIPHVTKVITLLLSDAYLQCDNNYTYVFAIGYYNFTELAKVASVELVKGTTGGFLVPESLSERLGENCSLVLPFLGSFNMTVTGVIKAPRLESVLGKSKLLMVPYTKLPGVTPNALVLIVDNPKNVALVTKELDKLTGGQAYILSQRSLARLEELIRLTSNVISFSIGILTLSIVSIALAVMMIMDIRSRTWEIGLLKAVGYTSRQLASIYVLETLVYAVSSLVIGLGLASKTIQYLRTYFMNEFISQGFEIGRVLGSMNLSLYQILIASVVTVTMMLLSAAIPILLVRRLDPVQALRTIE